MMKIFLVYREQVNVAEYLTAVFLTKSLADNFAREVENMSRGTGCKVRVAESHISTYGMTYESSRKSTDAFNAIVAAL